MCTTCRHSSHTALWVHRHHTSSELREFCSESISETRASLGRSAVGISCTTRSRWPLAAAYSHLCQKGASFIGFDQFLMSVAKESTHTTAACTLVMISLVLSVMMRDVHNMSTLFTHSSWGATATTPPRNSENFVQNPSARLERASGALSASVSRLAPVGRSLPPTPTFSKRRIFHRF